MQQDLENSVWRLSHPILQHQAQNFICDYHANHVHASNLVNDSYAISTAEKKQFSASVSFLLNSLTLFRLNLKRKRSAYFAEMLTPDLDLHCYCGDSSLAGPQPRIPPGGLKPLFDKAQTYLRKIPKPPSPVHIKNDSVASKKPRPIPVKKVHFSDEQWPAKSDFLHCNVLKARAEQTYLINQLKDTSCSSLPKKPLPILTDSSTCDLDNNNSKVSSQSCALKQKTSIESQTKLSNVIENSVENIENLDPLKVGKQDTAVESSHLHFLSNIIHNSVRTNERHNVSSKSNDLKQDIASNLDTNIFSEVVQNLDCKNHSTEVNAGRVFPEENSHILSNIADSSQSQTNDLADINSNFITNLSFKIQCLKEKVSTRGNYNTCASKDSENLQQKELDCNEIKDVSLDSDSNDLLVSNPILPHNHVVSDSKNVQISQKRPPLISVTPRHKKICTRFKKDNRMISFKQKRTPKRRRIQFKSRPYPIRTYSHNDNLMCTNLTLSFYESRLLLYNVKNPFVNSVFPRFRNDSDCLYPLRRIDHIIEKERALDNLFRKQEISFRRSNRSKYKLINYHN